MVEELEIYPAHKLLLNIENIEPDRYSIVPRLRIYVNMRYTIDTGHMQKRISITLLSSKFSIAKSIKLMKEEFMHVGIAYPDNHIIRFMSPGKSTILIYVDLDPYKLKKIEQIRDGENLIIRLNLYLTIHDIENSNFINSSNLFLKKRISKSDWIEKFLYTFNFKRTFIAELPVIAKKDFGKIMDALDKAWHYYYSGDPKEAVSCCRQALEGLTTLLRDYGYETEAIDDRGRTKRVPDWNRLLGNKKLAKIIKSLVISHREFTSPGAHFGKMVSKEDAELALLLTFGLINYFEKTLIKKER